MRRFSLGAFAACGDGGSGGKWDYRKRTVSLAELFCTDYRRQHEQKSISEKPEKAKIKYVIKHERGSSARNYF